MISWARATPLGMLVWPLWPIAAIAGTGSALDVPSMLLAAARGDIAVLEQWVVAGGDLNARDSKENTALLASSVAGQAAVVDDEDAHAMSVAPPALTWGLSAPGRGPGPPWR